MSIKRIFITLTIITVLTIGGLLIYSSGRTYFNEEEEIGNTAGNIYNGGLFCEQDGKIYFSNDNADGSLYVTTPSFSKFEEISDDKAVYINADENYIYYVRANNTRENNNSSFLMFYNTGVYRIKQNGSGLMAFTGNPGAYLTLKGNNIFFQRYDVGIGLHLYKYQIDGSLERLMVKDAVIPAGVYNNSVFYTGYSQDHNISAVDLSSFTARTYFNGSFMYPIFTADYVYYIDIEDNYKIYRMLMDGTSPELLVKKRCSTYNITNSGKYLYYQIDDTKNNSIRRLNLETLQEELLLEGNYKQIHVTEDYVFFKDFNNSNTYIMEADGINAVNTFSPPNLAK